MFFFCDRGQVLTRLCQMLQSVQPRGSVPKQPEPAEPLLPWGGLRAARDSANTVPGASLSLACRWRGTGTHDPGMLVPPQSWVLCMLSQI